MRLVPPYAIFSFWGVFLWYHEKWYHGSVNTPNEEEAAAILGALS